MAQRVVQKILLEYLDFARNKQVVGAILLAIKHVDKSQAVVAREGVA